ncbi:MAG TPA: NAD(P)/FAD-dependent oxidoreductase [Bradyrhizobium sp.]|jgi:flavin-dependent dehydrogenase|uniref:NAD(P)/FAD-dependent oxidoreductase n=1 Tax=Bradyrhizobium sp. TaxID=376 RepID=UPI002CB37EB4|nr:NAD(P)/FAD-dependent oxidoreductase [Bradyrhizobium sp.]HTB00519.1 NAD(P)/FAD-dependent oxidoreductase [Bradyrhizobium sp.]
MLMNYDVVVIGGGPAGSTVAALVKKYSPQLSVLVLEKAHFPRHHVGESLLAAASPVLHEMGAYDRINQYGFIEKLGASYVWGQNRQPWGFEFSKLIADLVKQGQRLPEMYTKGWHVRRAEYDHLLLMTAADAGAEVRFGARVSDVVIDEASQRVVGAKFSQDGRDYVVKSSWVIDASGQDGLLSRKFQLRQYDERMNNFALWGYWQGAKWEMKYLGHPNLARIFVATTPRGWIWYIPVRHDVISVGLVTHRDILKDSAVDPEALYREEVAVCPEIHGLLGGAKLIRLSDDQKRDICVIRDWSYDSRKMAGLGWALVGDAAGFVDPILSSGVMLAHELGQKAACAINSSFRAANDEEVQRYWTFYEDTYRTYLDAYRSMASFWYNNNFSMESWWWQARRGLAKAQSKVDLSSAESFMRVASGYANRAESLSLFGSYPLHEAQSLVNGLFGKAAVQERTVEKYASGPVRLQARAVLTNGQYFYRGFVREAPRIVNQENDQYLDLHPGEDVLVDLLDGSHSLSDLNRMATGIRHANPRLPIRTGTELLVQLDSIGAISFG